jgi:two-component system cell cycle sensor histidine kinase/response regulator CckA
MAPGNQQSAVAESRKLCRNLMDAVNDAILIFDPRSFRILDANRSASEIYGYSREELIGKEMRDLTHEVPNYSDLLHSSAHKIERTDYNKAGEKLEFLVSLGLIEYRGRKAVLSINRDIRERKRVENAIVAAEKKCRTVVNNISEIVALTDPQGLINLISPQVERILGFSPQELQGQSVFGFIHPDDRPRAADEYATTIERTGQNVPSVLRFRNSNSQWIPLEVVASNQLNDPHIAAVIFTARDLRYRHEAARSAREANADFERHVMARTNELAKANAALRIENQRRRYTESQLQQSLSLFHATLESTADGILVVSKEGKISSHNQKFIEMWRMPRMTLTGLSDEDLVPIAFSQLQDPAAFQAGLQSLYAKPEAVSFDTLLLKDGRIFERYSQPQSIGEQIVGRVWSFRDVTHARQLEEELRQAQKMEAVGRLAGGVAHDFNNLLMLISGYASQILEDKNLASQHRESCEQLVAAASRAAAFTRQLLAFSRKNPVLPEVVDLNRVVAGMQKILQRLVSGRIQLVVKLFGEPLPVYVDPSQIELMIMNLAINARDAMPDGGVLTLSTTHEVVGGDDKPPSEAAPTEYVVLQVADTGYGMSDEIKRHIFEPFFTTKEVGKGTGLGLSTVYGIVEQAEGYINVESQPNEGSIFHIFLPRSKQPVSEKAKVQDFSPETGNETILLVEDETGIRTMTRMYLESLGYKVLEADNGREATQISRQHQGVIDLLLTDVVMPGMRGDELVRMLRGERPALAVVFISGYPDLHDLDTGVTVLEKPFAFPDLGRCVRSVLNDAQQEMTKREKPRTRRQA